MTSSIEDVLAQARPKATTVRVCLRGDLLAEHDRLEAELAEVRRQDALSNRPSTAAEVAGRIEALQAQIEASSVQFTFHAVGQKRWTDLLVEHPPSEEDREEGAAFDRRTFPVAALAASCVEPAMTQEQAARLYEVCNFGQWEQLWGACIAANVEGTSVPFSFAASAVLRGYETSSEQPTTTESLEVSSSGE